MKYFNEDDEIYTLKASSRVFSFGFDGYKKGNFWIEECCDNYFAVEMSNQEAIEMFEEAIAIIKSKS